MAKEAATKIGKDQVVSIHYSLFDDSKEVLDSSKGAEPLDYLHGHGQIVSGLETALLGKTVGEKFSVTVPAKDGYGEYQDALKLQVDKSQFPKGADIKEGITFELAGEDNHSMLARVIKVESDLVTLDANHPLAGKTLYFDIEVIAIRNATKEELSHGHAHGPGGHHHH